MPGWQPCLVRVTYKGKEEEAAKCNNAWLVGFLLPRCRFLTGGAVFNNFFQKQKDETLLFSSGKVAPVTFFWGVGGWAHKIFGGTRPKFRFHGTILTDGAVCFFPSSSGMT